MCAGSSGRGTFDAQHELIPPSESSNVQEYTLKFVCYFVFDGICEFIFPPSCNATLGSYSEIGLLCDVYGSGNGTDIQQAVLVYRGDMTSVWLDENEIVSIEPYSFMGLTSIETLLLSNNTLVSLSADTFAGLSSLQCLYLGVNQLERIEAGSFRGLLNLVYLSLDVNKLTTLPNGAFVDGLANLFELDLT